MPMNDDFAIVSKQLNKNFKSYVKPTGLMGSIGSIFKREYRVKSAVLNFDLEIKKGKIIGLLGPNGAGKTTLMKMFTGIIVPSSGDLKILGQQPWERSKDFRKKIALVMGQKSQLWWDIPAMDSLELLQKYYEISSKDFVNRVEEMASLLNVKELLQIQIRKLSLGERMKMELMASLLHHPEVIFLDEPTIGLDLVAQENIRKFIKNYHREHNCTIILTSHYMADIHALCKELILIFNGEKKYDGGIRKFENILGKEKNISFSFNSSLKDNNSYFDKFDPKWSSDYKSVDLRIPEDEVNIASLHIIKNFSPSEFNTEKMPIERVMKKLMEDPKILQQ